MAQMVPWDEGQENNETLDRAVELLRGGSVIALPTETVYGIAALASSSAGIARLVRGKQRPAEKPVALAVRDSLEAYEWVPNMSALARRLASRAWPGPLTLVLDQVDSPKTQELPSDIRQTLCPNGTLGLRVPNHSAIVRIMGKLGEPLALSSANISGQPPAVTAQQAVESLGEEVELVIDGGACALGQPSTVVRVQQASWTVLREGALSAKEIQSMAAQLIVFLCTGNTCRSPLAEGICKQLLSQRLACVPSDLPQRGFVVTSAGLAAHPGSPATPEAIEIARERQIDLTRHFSQQASGPLLSQADLIFAMTGDQVSLLRHLIDGNLPLRTLRADGDDLHDPIGGDEGVYRQCADRIESEIRNWLSSLPVESTAGAA